MTARQGQRWMDTLERRRLTRVLPHIRGRLLDVGCGFNNLVRLYGSGVGVDVYCWPGVQVLIGGSGPLPFVDRTFDVVSMVAVLNHIPARQHALVEARRVLVDGGRLLVTMIGPKTGAIAHVFFGRDEKTRGGFGEGERVGMTQREIRDLLASAGFVVVRAVPFQLGLNRVYIAAKA